MQVVHFLPPLSDTEVLEVRSAIVGFWNVLRSCNDLSGTIRELLREMEIEVTDLLAAGSPSDVYRAWQITVRADYIRRDPPHE